MENAFTKTPEDVAKEFQTELKNGLSTSDAVARLQKYGTNELKEGKGKNPLILFFEQFTDFLILILIAASIISFILGERIDAYMIIAIVLINGIVGFIQEYRVEKAIEHLKKLVTSNTKVYRGGQLLQIPSKEIVPGDLVVLEEGQKVPADIRLIQSFSLSTIEAALTGESTPVNKSVEALQDSTPIADQKNMVFSGTIISSGGGMGIVISTGMNTELGKIAKLVTNEPEPVTPMQKKLNHLGSLIGKIVLGIASIVALEEIFFGEQQIIQALISGVALAVAAIPEGLPAVVTISLALGTKRLLKQNALIRNLPAAETLGSTDVICADKTGTLTEGVMSVRKIYINGSTVTLENTPGVFGSTSLTTSGDFTPGVDDGVKKLLEHGILASNARSSDGKIIGDSTEAALIQIAIDSSINQQALITKYPRVTEVPFSSSRKMMTTVLQADSDLLVTSKGATEVILDKCTKIEKNGKISAITQIDKDEILKINEQMAKDALRVLAFAYKTAEQNTPGVGHPTTQADTPGVDDVE